MKRYLILLLPLIPCACSVVTSTVPVGESPMLLNEKEWSGKWIGTDLTDNGYLEINIISPDEGVLRAIIYEEGKTDETYLAYIRSTGDWEFISVREDEDDDAYLWGVLRKRDHEILLWMPLADRFVEAVKNGVLPGHVKNDSVTLSPMSMQQIETMMSGVNGTFFFWTEPIILIRPKE